MQPSSQPTKQPSVQPSTQPSLQPFAQPSGQPSTQPSRQPTFQPNSQPTAHPSSQPSSQPSIQPSIQPLLSPSAQPSRKPSGAPSRQPSTQPSCQPSNQPSSHPSIQPSVPPSEQPHAAPSGQPSSQPIAQPSAWPTSQPASYPTVQPSAQPSTQPSYRPSGQPSKLPSMLPTSQPSSQPSRQPTMRPSTQPSESPSEQPVCAPSAQPSRQPTVIPTCQPSLQPSRYPSAQPSTEPSSQFTTKPSSSPSGQPSSAPTISPSAQPTNQPSLQPSAQPTSQPSALPSAQPTDVPSGQPSGIPSSQPSVAPNARPSQQPSSQPSSQPLSASTNLPSQAPTELTLDAREYVLILPAATSMLLDTLTYIDDANWICSEKEDTASCTVINPSGTLRTQYTFPWVQTTSVLQSVPQCIWLSGYTKSQNSAVSNIARCVLVETQWQCNVKAYRDTILQAGSISPSVDKLVYVGTYNGFTSISIVNTALTVSNTYKYTANIIKAMSMTHIYSPPNFVGSFVAGTCTSVGSMTYILAGMVRTDSGYLTAMYVTPVSGTIINSAELVNAMALDYVQADSFIGGGLQVAGEPNLSAYILCVNALYQSVRYGVHYQINPILHNGRRVLTDASVVRSTTKGLIVIDSVMYVLVSWNTSIHGATLHRMSLLKTAIASGAILQQVHIVANTSSLYCSHISLADSYLTIGCIVQASNSTDRMLLSADRQLTFSQLPVEFTRSDQEIFTGEAVRFQRTKITVTPEKTSISVTDSTFSTSKNSPTIRPTVMTTNPPSVQPSVVPSTQPSSSPTAAPSVSPQPTSQPSSGSPTNTYKPTVKDTIKPTPSPSLAPTVLPTNQPTPVSSVRPTLQPCIHPSTQPNATPATLPTRTPLIKPTVRPTVAPTMKPTYAPSSISSNVGTSTAAVIAGKKQKSSLVLVIGGSILGGLLFLWGGHRLLTWYVYTQDVREKRKAMRDLIQNVHIPLSNIPLPAAPPVQNKDIPDFPFRGAYAVGRPIVVSHNEISGQPPSHMNPPTTILATTVGTLVNPDLEDTTPVEYMNGDDVAVNENGDSDSSSSIELSSLHSSERSGASFSFLPESQCLSEVTVSTPLSQTRSKESAMEEGSIFNSSTDSKGNH